MELYYNAHYFYFWSNFVFKLSRDEPGEGKNRGEIHLFKRAASIKVRFVNF